MSTRSRRDAALDNIESLILAQAVWEHGADAWPTVAKILSKHPLISRPKSFFTAQSSHAMHDNLMKEAGLERTEACNAIRSNVHLELAKKFYWARVEELRGLILAEEIKFKSILSEIESIRSGNFDGEITARITGVPAVSEAAPSPTEVFDGSELSGLSATPVSPSQTQENPPEQPEPSPVGGVAPEPRQPPTPKVAKPVRTPSATDETPSSPLLSTPSPVAIEVEKAVVDDKGEAGEPFKTDKHSEVNVARAEGPVPGPSIRTDSTVGQGRRGLSVDQEDKRNDVEEKEAEAETVVHEALEAPEATEGDAEAARAREEPAAATTGDIQIIQPRDTAARPAAAATEAVEESLPESPAVPEVEAELAVEDGESSGEEPLHASRRSTRRRRSTLSQAQPPQTRGKARRQKAESPVIKAKEELEVEQMDETDDVQVETPNVDLEDASPAPADVATRRRDGKRKASFFEGVESMRERKRARDDSEPVDDDEPVHALRGRRSGTRSEEQVALKRFQNVIGMLHSQISQHRNGVIFHNPIKNSEAPDYHEIVKRPMDLKTIKMRVKDGSIGNSLEYQRDTYLMFANALMYNRPGSDVYTMAEDMMLESEGHILAFRQTEGFLRGAHRT
ncbi:putative bromo domain containing protein [Lyophyllum shimeji]|uniref:Bromo domain containing protein n=1 Tax=Lyophyllum shimeji TaxID=47721 RepID=A0A9P3UI24_LYOSH|nr:putative bromo domain containing protein [Lyophyllum shimeji]